MSDIKNEPPKEFSNPVIDRSTLRKDKFATGIKFTGNDSSKSSEENEHVSDLPG